MQTIFIIEDDQQIRDFYKRMFGATGRRDLRIIEADNAEDATRILVRQEIDIVLLDILMPGIDGTVMAEVIREYNPEMKVIVCSVCPVDEQKKMIPFATYYFDKSHGFFKIIEKVCEELAIAEKVA